MCFCILLLALPGCSNIERLTVVQYTSQRSISLVPSKDLSRHGSLLAQVVGQRDGESFSFLVQVEASNDELIVVGLTPFKTRAWVVRYRGNEYSFSNHPIFPIPIPPKQFLAELQYAYFIDSPLPKCKNGESASVVSEVEFVCAKAGRKLRVANLYDGYIFSVESIQSDLHAPS